jgi:HK97 family phage prohead protease
MKQIRNLTFKDIQLRASESEGKKTLVGIIPYNSRSEDMGGFKEMISPTAFNKTLADKANVSALFAHDVSKVLGSTRSGTLRLVSSDEGLLAECDLPNTTYANDLYEIISRSDCNTMSFGFQPVKHKDTGNLRTLTEVALKEISFGVLMPAYAETNSAAQLRTILEVRKVDISVLTEILSKDNLDEADQKVLSEIIGELSKLVPSQEEAPVEEKVEEKPAADEQPADATVAEALENLKLALELEIENEI